MTVSLLSLGGLPPTAGFIGKWYIFSAAVSAGYYGLADHRRADERHLRLLLPARRRDDVHGRPRRRAACRARVTGVGMAALAVSIAAIFYLGVLPTQVLDLAANSIATIF